MGKNSASRINYSQVVAGIAALVSLMFGACAAEAASFLNSCTTFCHGASPRDGARKGNLHFGSQSSAFVGNHKNHLSPAPTTNDCSICHAPVSGTGFGHQNGVIDMAVKLKGYSAATGRAKYDKGVFFNQTSIPNLTNATCSNVNCHFEKKTPIWGSASLGAADTTSCAICHGALPASLAHSKHLTTLGSSISACANCHSDHSIEAKPFVHATSAGRSITVTVGTYAGSNNRYLPSQASGRVVGNCTTTYCHNNGTVASGTHPAVTWSSTFSTCAECHGNAASLATGSHAKHLAVAGVTCANCHNATASSNTAISTFANHVNKSVTINFAASAAVAGGTYNGQIAGGTTVYQKPVGSAAGACATIICHGSNSGTWGVANTDATCVKCHGVVGTSPAAYTANINTAAPGYNGTGVNTAGTVGTITGGVSNDSKVGAHDTHLKGTGGYKTGGVACTDCHAVTALGDAGHMSGSTTMTWSNLAKNVGTTPYNADKGVIVPSYSAPTCAANYCHGGGFSAAVQGTGISVSWVDGSYLANPAATKNATDCNRCHQSPPTSSVKYGHAGLTIASDCSGCHGHNGSGPTHIDGTLQASGAVSSGGSPCYGCHSVYNVMNGSTSVFHHVLDDASPDQAPNAGTYPSSQTVLACTSCHTDHNYTNTNKGANLRTAYNAAAGSRDNHDFSTTAPYGLCVSCHSTAQTKSTAQVVAGTATTIVIDGSATGFQASMHNYTASSFFGTSPFSANCVKCHTDEQTKDKQTSGLPDKFGPHYSAQRSLLNPMGATPQAAAGADFCFRCHHKAGDTNPGGGPAKTTALKDYFGSKTMTAAAEDIFSSIQLANRHNVSSYKGLHKDNETRADIAATKHVECVDCHDPHLAKSGTHTAGSATLAGVLTGVSGVDVTTWGANWAGVTTYNPSTTTAALITATAEWQICFKCHSGANANVATWGGTGAAAFTDLGLEFNPNNASRHPIGTPLSTSFGTSALNKQLAANRLSNGWTPGSVMTCSDCHSTDSTASKGPHGSSVKWMLAGANKAWPYNSASLNGTVGNGTVGDTSLYTLGNATTANVGTTNGLFCLNCHPVKLTNAFHITVNGFSLGGHSSWRNTGACVGCHIRVPHGGKISRLLVTVNAPSRYKTDGNGMAVYFSSWAPMGSNTTDATSGRWNGSCGTHSGGTESW